MLFVIIMVVPILFLLSLIYYNYVNDCVLNNSQLIINQSTKSVVETIVNTEKSYELVSNNYNTMMAESLEDFNKEYEENIDDLSKIDMLTIKERYQNLLDLYIIDSDGIIVYSTFPTSLGIDFKEFPDFYENLTGIRKGNKVEISAVTSELRTNELRKWGYMPTKDHKYVLEVGIASNELEKYIKKLNYLEIAKSLKESNPFVKDLMVYDAHIFKLGYGEEEKDKEKIKIIDHVFKSKQNHKIFNSHGFLDKEYIYVNTFSNALDDSQKVIEITYTYDSVMRELSAIKKNTITFIFMYTLFSLLIIYMLTSKYITKPLIKLTNEIRNISSSNLHVSLAAESNNEIGLLEKSFNSMSENLENTLISKKYLENIIDSIGDILIILDRDFNIFRINRYALNVLGKNEDELLDMPIKMLFEDSFSETELKKKFESVQTIENIENTLIKSDNSKTVILSSFSVIYGEEKQIFGYICNAKDISKTKDALQKLEESNFKLVQKEAYLRERSIKDSLTGLYNRGYIMKILADVIEKAEAENSTFSVIMLDIDYFKRVNDKYGHQAGDDVLKGVSTIISNNLRKTDFAGRYGGEEFLVILPDANEQEGLKIAERIRTETKNTKFHNDIINITISGGIIEWNKETDSEIFNKVDMLLYEAKKGGRDRIWGQSSNN